MEVQERTDMRGKVLAIRNCDWCGEAVEIRHKQRLTYKHIFCSRKCNREYILNQTVKESVCPICGNTFHKKKSYRDKYKTICCSKECRIEADRIRMTGSGNHQYGLKGKLNSSWKSDEKTSSYGYKLIRSQSHPFVNCDGFVFEHRLIVEENLLIPENTIEIDGKQYLSPDWEVHHINYNRLDNTIINLFPLPASLHMKFHTSNRKLKDENEETKRTEFLAFVEHEPICKNILNYYIKVCNDNTTAERLGGFGSSGK